MATIETDWSNAVRHELNADVVIKSESTGGYVLYLPCSLESSSREMRIPKRYPPDVIRKKLLQKGWRVGRHLTCPHCAATRPNAHKRVSGLPPAQSQQTTQPPAIVVSQPLKVDSFAALGQALLEDQKAAAKNPEKENPAAQTPIISTPEETRPQPRVFFLDPKKKEDPPAPVGKTAARNPRNKKPDYSPEEKAMLILERVFLPESGSFTRDSKGYYSDARVAADSGVPVGQVVELRKQWFGELRVSPEFEALLAKESALKIKIKQVEEDYEVQMANLRRELETTSKTLERLSAENGWSV